MAYRFLNDFTEHDYYNPEAFEYSDSSNENNNNENELNDFLEEDPNPDNINEESQEKGASNNDYEVENYDIDTLFKFLNLDKESTEFQIKDSANNLAVAMKNKKKKGLSIFFESIRDKLLDWKKEERDKKNIDQTTPLPMGLWLDYDQRNINNNANANANNANANANNANANANHASASANHASASANNANANANANNASASANNDNNANANSTSLLRSSSQSPIPHPYQLMPRSPLYKSKNKSKSKKTNHLFRINTLDLKEDEQTPNLFVYNFPSSFYNKHIKSYSVQSIQVSIKNTFEEDQYFDFNSKPYFIPKGYYTTETLREKVSELTNGELSISFHDKKTRFTNGANNSKDYSNANDASNAKGANRIMFGLYPNKSLFYSLGMRDNNKNLDKNENEIIEYESLDYIINEDFHKLNTSNYFELYIDYLANPKIANNSPLAIFQTSPTTTCMTTNIDKQSFSSVKKRVDSEAKQLYIKVLDDNGNLIKLNERVGIIILKVTT
jgi:hypothetical protein